MPLSIRKLTGRIGAVVDGVDSETSTSNEWHSDVAFVVNPPQVTTLRSIVTTPYGGETLVANAAAAYRDLPEPLRRLAESLRAVHSNQFDYARPPGESELYQECDRVFVATPYIDDYDDHPRRLNRVTVAGDIPVGADDRLSTQLVGDASHYTSVLAVSP